MTEEPLLIRRATSEEEAQLIVAWLDEHGVEATIPGRQSTGVLAFGITDDEGVGIYVANEQSARQAQGLLAEHDRQQAAVAARASGVTEIKTRCEECNHVVSFAVELAGSVQTCPNCGAYVDVPDGSEQSNETAGAPSPEAPGAGSTAE